MGTLPQQPRFWAQGLTVRILGSQAHPGMALSQPLTGFRKGSTQRAGRPHRQHLEQSHQPGLGCWDVCISPSHIYENRWSGHIRAPQAEVTKIPSRGRAASYQGPLEQERALRAWSPGLQLPKPTLPATPCRCVQTRAHMAIICDLSLDADHRDWVEA